MTTSSDARAAVLAGPLQIEDDARERSAVLMAAAVGITPPAPLVGERVEAVVNHGRWVVHCPVCPSARLAHPDRLWWCVECGAGAYAVEFPADADGIAAALAARPVGNRHWLPGESVADLLEQNAARGAVG